MIVWGGTPETSTGGRYCSATNRPPDCSEAAPSLQILAPPNHRLVTVAIEGLQDPDGDPLRIRITGIRQDEPVQGEGAGRSCPDGSGLGFNVANLRAERSGTGNGRVYHVGFEADDGRGGTCAGTIIVCVPKDVSRGHRCGDEGPLVDSTGPCAR